MFLKRGWQMGLQDKPLVIGAAIPSLVSCGLSPDADLVYRTLVTRGADCAKELARSLGLPRRRILDALDELAARDAAVLAPPARPEAAVWCAHPPAKVLPALRRAARRPRPVSYADPVRADRAIGIPLSDGLRHLPSRAAARTRMADLVATASREHLAMNTEQSFEPEATRAAAPLDRALLSRNIRLRVLGLQPVDVDPLEAHGHRPPDRMPDYRQMTEAPMKLIVVDRAVALFPVDPADFDRGYLEVAHQPVVSALVALFERNWENARVPPAGGPGCTPLSAREQALITLLAAGHTDISAAQRMQISPRSVTNIMRSLMDRLNVENRFQLGLMLGAQYAFALPTKTDSEER
jgi:DNA-binding CsgD family transcriptional regulator/sugar-specific transcriptional regulator TrmB